MNGSISLVREEPLTVLSFTVPAMALSAQSHRVVHARSVTRALLSDSSTSGLHRTSAKEIMPGSSALQVGVLIVLKYEIICMHALKGLPLPRASHFDGIPLSGSHHLSSMLVAASVLFAHAAVTISETN
jgi:hypothetical protein